MTFDIPPFIGPFHVGSLIYPSTHADVYESFHPMQCTKLAIKAIRKAGVNPQTIEDECILMTEIEHPNIIRAIDFYDLPNYKCIVMPLATGGDLYELITSRGRIPEVQACKIMFNALQALKHLHHLGIWHRDIKPENIFLMNEDLNEPNIILADLGFAKIFEENELSQDWLGTPLYAAPEIYKRIPCMYSNSTKKKQM